MVLLLLLLLLVVECFESGTWSAGRLGEAGGLLELLLLPPPQLLLLVGCCGRLEVLPGGSAACWQLLRTWQLLSGPC
jgi:hypothetical protein